MSIIQMNRAFEDQEIKGNEKLVMLALGDNANDSGVSFPSWTNLLRRTCMARSTLSEVFNKLEKKGKLFRISRTRQNGSKTSNKFLVYPHDNQELLDEPDFLIFEEKYQQSSESELGSKVRNPNYQSSEFELPKGGQSSESELLEPSLISLTPNINHHLSDAEQIANYLFQKIQTVKPDFKQPNIKTWSKDIDLAIRLDKRTKEQLKICIDWIYTHEGTFWQANILSGKKLREKYDTISMQIGRVNKNTNDKILNDFDTFYESAYGKVDVIDVKQIKG